MKTRKTKLEIGKETYGNIPLEDIILEYAVNKINKEKGYEFVKIKK